MDWPGPWPEARQRGGQFADGGQGRRAIRVVADDDDIPGRVLVGQFDDRARHDACLFAQKAHGGRALAHAEQLYDIGTR